MRLFSKAPSWNWLRVFIIAISFILRLKFQNKPINIFERTSLRMARAWETIYIHIYYIYTYILYIYIRFTDHREWIRVCSTGIFFIGSHWEAHPSRYNGVPIEVHITIGDVSGGPSMRCHVTERRQPYIERGLYWIYIYMYVYVWVYTI